MDSTDIYRILHPVAAEYIFFLWLMYFLYKNEYSILKPVEITIRKGLRQKGER
jgi:hypothetical protein